MCRLLLAAVVTPLCVAAGADRAYAVYASAINGGCYIVGPNDCRVHADPVTINIASGYGLEAAQIMLNGVTVYDFKTDVSNPPAPPTCPLVSPALDFGVRCGETYVMNIVGKPGLPRGAEPQRLGAPGASARPRASSNVRRLRLQPGSKVRQPRSP